MKIRGSGVQLKQQWYIFQSKKAEKKDAQIKSHTPTNAP